MKKMNYNTKWRYVHCCYKSDYKMDFSEWWQWHTQAAKHDAPLPLTSMPRSHFFAQSHAVYRVPAHSILNCPSEQNVYQVWNIASPPFFFFFFFLSHPMLSIYTHAQVSRNSRQQRYPDNNNSSQMSTHKPNEIQYFLCCWCIFLHSLFCPTTVILLQKKKGRFCLFKLQNFCFSKLKSLLLLRVCHLQNYILLWCMQI